MPYLYSLDGKPSGPNCRGRYPLAIKGCREYFSTDVVGAIHVRVDGCSPFDAVPTFVARPREAGVVLLLGSQVRVVGRKRIAIQEAGTARIGFLSDEHRDARPLRFVGEQLDEFGMRDLHELLIVLLAQLHPPLPIGIFPNHQGEKQLLRKYLSVILYLS
jgi:hypothetical protein